MTLVFTEHKGRPQNVTAVKSWVPSCTAIRPGNRRSRELERYQEDALLVQESEVLVISLEASCTGLP